MSTVRVRPSFLLAVVPALLSTACTSVSTPAAPASWSTSLQDGPDSAEQLAKKLANPVASLISVPVQLNYDRGLGVGDDGSRWICNVQPVVPMELNADWNLISRTILPFVRVADLSPGSGSETGLGDIVQSAFFSPKEPIAGGWIVGAGPVLLLPTATENVLGQDKLGLGPTGVALRQSGPWTYGGLANHIWSVAGDGDRPEVNATFLQPFVSFTTPDAWTYSLNIESTYDWRSADWSIPVNVAVAKLVRIGDQMCSLGAGVRYWAESPAGGPEDLGFRAVFTLLF